MLTRVPKARKIGPVRLVNLRTFFGINSSLCALWGLGREGRFDLQKSGSLRTYQIGQAVPRR
jgi:hypothetical protein